MVPKADDSELLLHEARTRTGLFDFGPDGWQEGFERLVAAAHSDISDPDEVARVEELIVTRLVTRLRIEDWYCAHAPETSHPVGGPLVIFGLPRTATTALQHLLSLDPALRYLRRWELDDPVPPPDASTESEDPRRLSQSDRADQQHIRRMDGPVEDGRIHELCFENSELVLPVPSYTEWWRSADHDAVLPYHERVLRLLHSHRPPRHWLLKFPNYLFLLPQVTAQYPDVRFVMTHRDPTVVVPSACSVVFASRRRRLPNATLDSDAFGTEVLEHLLVGVRRAMEARDALGPDRFLDVGQQQFETDPVGMAERIYEFAGLELDGTVRDAHATWASENQPGSRGAHHYRAEDFGLTAEGIASAFSTYLDRYGEYCAPASRPRR